jgi:heme/copper-type cytochrome/quinol oxidase subunit 1
VHTNVRRFVKTAIGFLFAGLLIGVWMIMQRELSGVWPGAYLVSAHAHAVQLGFVMFLILGVALWLFPKPPADDTRYRPGRIATSYWILTLTTAARVVGEIARSEADAGWLRWLVTLAGLGQVVGFGVYFWTMWPRIRPVGSHLREAKGERF